MKKSYIIAAVLTLALTAWVLGGYFLRTVGKEADGTTPVADAAPTMRVAVRTQEAKPVSQIVVAQGQAEPNRTVTVRAETLGQIAEILADEGSTVAAGDVIARLEPNAREARIEAEKIVAELKNLELA